VIAVVIVGLIYAALSRKILKVRFGNARWGFVYSRLRAKRKRERFPDDAL